MLNRLGIKFTMSCMLTIPSLEIKIRFRSRSIVLKIWSIFNIQQILREFIFQNSKVRRTRKTAFKFWNLRQLKRIILQTLVCDLDVMRNRLLKLLFIALFISNLKLLDNLIQLSAIITHTTLTTILLSRWTRSKNIHPCLLTLLWLFLRSIIQDFRFKLKSIIQTFDSNLESVLGSCRHKIRIS